MTIETTTTDGTTVATFPYRNVSATVRQTPDLFERDAVLVDIPGPVGALADLSETGTGFTITLRNDAGQVLAAALTAHYGVVDTTPVQATTTPVATITHSEAVEGLAQVLCAAHQGEGCLPWDQETDAWRQTYRDMATAVIETRSANGPVVVPDVTSAAVPHRS